MHAILRGRDHETLGVTEIAEVTPGLAIGLTRGRHPKSYAHTDPNEDVVGVRTAGGRVAMYVADGHSGHQGSHIAIDELERRLGEDITVLDARQAAIRELHGVNEAIRDGRRGLPGNARRTRTTLALAVAEVSEGTATLLTAAVGDSVVLAVSPSSGARTLTRDRRRFMGDRCSLPEMAGAAHLASTELQGDEIVVVASDGLTNFARLDDIGLAVADSGSASAAVEALIELAGDGGAGDNVAVAVMAVMTVGGTRG